MLRPTASTLATSSYVNVPAIPTSPVTVRVPPIDTLPLNIPSPVTLIPVFVVLSLKLLANPRATDLSLV